MFKLAFSTIACPNWTLETVAKRAAEWEYDGVEFRSNGSGDTQFANDPELADPNKVRATLRRHGLDNAGLATGCAFDAPILPPVLGHFFLARHKPVNDANHMVDTARDVGAPTTRVFAFDIPQLPLESRRTTLRRVCDRLKLVCDHARHRDTLVMIENGGAFASHTDLQDIINRVAAPNLVACYDLLAAHTVEDDIEQAINALRPRLAAARLRDRDLNTNHPTPLGTGHLPTKHFVQTLANTNFTGWLTYEWEAAWLAHLDPAETILPNIPKQIADWVNPNSHTNSAA